MHSKAAKIPILKKNKGINKHRNETVMTVKAREVPSDRPSAGPGSRSSLSALQSQFAKKLEGGRFRYLNEQLYTSHSADSWQQYQSDPSLFDVYHSGYRSQVSSWPENPLLRVIDWINTHHLGQIVADMGCGEALLAESVDPRVRVHSFDLVSRKPIVTACDIAHTPLANNSVDVVIFCLSLMGTNITEFLAEAYRILKPGGSMRIVEVRSRFETKEEGIKKFLNILRKGGFKVNHMDNNSNRMFFDIDCIKAGAEGSFKEEFTAKACKYKKR